MVYCDANRLSRSSSRLVTPPALPPPSLPPLLPPSRARASSRQLRFTFAWSFRNDEIVVAIEAATTGWVGFGLGERGSGAMAGSDLLTCTGEGELIDVRQAVLDHSSRFPPLYRPHTCRVRVLCSSKCSLEIRALAARWLACNPILFLIYVCRALPLALPRR